MVLLAEYFQVLYDKVPYKKNIKWVYLSGSLITCNDSDYVP
jgi:hypothetical protein